MATVNDIVNRAYRLLGVVASGEDTPSEYAEDALIAFNDMLHAWKLHNVDVSHSDLTLTDTFPLADQYREGTAYVLAGKLSPEYQAPAAFDADQWFRFIQAAYGTIPTMTAEDPLTRPPSRDDREHNLPLTHT